MCHWCRRSNVDHLPPPADALDETLEETFPASDPPANTVETGIRAGTPSLAAPQITDNQALSRLELTLDGQTAFLVYERSAQAMTLVHTEVPPELRGRHLGGALVEAAVATARTQGVRIVAICPFARSYLRTHPPS